MELCHFCPQLVEATGRCRACWRPTCGLHNLEHICTEAPVTRAPNGRVDSRVVRALLAKMAKKLIHGKILLREVFDEAKFERMERPQLRKFRS